MTTPDPTLMAAVLREPAFGSLVSLLIRLAHQKCETLDRTAPQRHYYECQICGGDDMERGHYKAEIAKVKHKEGCTLAQYLPALYAMSATSLERATEHERAAALERVGTEGGVGLMAAAKAKMIETGKSMGIPECPPTPAAPSAPAPTWDAERFVARCYESGRTSAAQVAGAAYSRGYADAAAALRAKLSDAP